MRIPFPISPTDGQSYVNGDVTYRYSSALSAWVVVTEGVLTTTDKAGTGSGLTTVTSGDIVDDTISDDDLSPALQALLFRTDGSNSPTADINWGGQGITNLRAATAAGEAVRYDEYVITENRSTFNAADIDSLEALTGMGNGAINLGTFPGSIISDNTTVKTALTEVEARLTITQGTVA